MGTDKKRLQPNELHFGLFSTYRNALYGFSILWIVVFHSLQLDKIHFDKSLDFFHQTISAGNIGVDIFMFLSGIGLYFSFSKEPKLKEFYCKRLIRVYVPYLLVMLPILIYYLLIKEQQVGLFIRYVLTINIWTNEDKIINFWYIAAILVCYLIFPLIYKFIFYKNKNAALRTAILVLLSVILILLIYIFFKDAYEILERSMSRLAVFIVGCYMGKPVKENKKFPAVILIISAFIIAGAYPLYSSNHSLTGLLMRYYGSLTGVSLVFVLSQIFEYLTPLKIDKVLAFFGGFSLEIYMISLLARKWYSNSKFYSGHIFVKYLVFMIIAIMIAYLVSLIEKPINKALLKRLYKNTSKKISDNQIKKH